jgi:hypothetical protein
MKKSALIPLTFLTVCLVRGNDVGVAKDSRALRAQLFILGPPYFKSWIRPCCLLANPKML